MIQPTAIPPVDGLSPRPFWSVMMPTYNAGDYFVEALQSVLSQDLGEAQMEIVVVDDCSPNSRAEQIVKELAPGRVRFHSQPQNVGLAENWNTCIRLSRGRWVHILHQDDRVLPGFYESLSRADPLQHVGAAFCRPTVIDSVGQISEVESLEQENAGPMSGWLRHIGERQRVQCASIVVRRAAYEQLGGFRVDLKYVVDWEMWMRIATKYDIWYEPCALAQYRMHPGNETTRLSRDAAHLDDLERFLPIAASHLQNGVCGDVLPAMRRHVGLWFRACAFERMHEGSWVRALKHAWRAASLGSVPARELVMFHKMATKQIVLRLLAKPRSGEAN